MDTADSMPWSETSVASHSHSPIVAVQYGSAKPRKENKLRTCKAFFSIA
ncbi:hypothetical protein AVEN_199600-1, partial [Araneus ventricosus]